MAKPAEVKKYFFDCVKELFDGAYVGEVDGKLYLNLTVGGETTQVCVAMTCPKNPIVVEETAPATPLDDGLTQAESDNLAELMSRLGL